MNKKEIGLRLREFLIGKYGKLIIAAEKLEIGPQNLNKYLNGDYVPGGKLIAKLSELGCDTNWLLGIENYKDAVTVGENNNGKDLYEVKDKIIIQQAEEIFKLKQDIKDATEQANKLEQRLKDLERRMKKESKPVKKKSSGKNVS